MVLYMRGGAHRQTYVEMHMDDETLDMITDLYGMSRGYIFIPEEEDMLDYFPSVDFQLIVQSSEKFGSNDLKEYITNDRFLVLNMNLNLLNKANDGEYFNEMMNACLGGMQKKMMEEMMVYWFGYFSDEEYLMYERNVGRCVFLKGFVVASRDGTKNEDSKTRMTIMIGNHSNGVLCVKDMVVLCAYSKYFVKGVDSENKSVELIYMDYYEYNAE